MGFNLMSKKDNLASTVERTVKKAEDTGLKAAESVKGVNLSDYRDKVQDMVDNAKRGVDKNVDNAKSNIREHPLESVAVSMGAGFIVGATMALGAGLLMGAAMAIMGRRYITKKSE